MPARGSLVPAAAQISEDEELEADILGFINDPLGYVLYAYPWGEPGPLQDYKGPDVWQHDFLVSIGQECASNRFDGKTPVPPIRRAVSSGHGVGKSTVAAWLVGWIMSTRPKCRGTVTANTFTQLETKTWAAVKNWTAMAVNKHWFVINDNRMYAADYKDAWFCAPQSCKEENSEAFAGQHEATSTSFYIFDEDSGIPDKIHEVSEGGLTDGEPMVFRFGNPTQNSGDFHRSCFGSMRDRWSPTIVDSRNSQFTNKAQLEEWIKDYGEDSDFVRVRVRGLPPRASELQFIDQGRVWEAQRRAHGGAFGDDPLLVGVDVSDGGSAWNVIRFRRGTDARSIPPIRIPGEAVRNDRSAMLARLSDVLERDYDGRRVAAMFIDSAFGAPYVERLRAMGHNNVIEVRFGAPSPDRHQANLRAYMWSMLKDWLSSALIDSKDTMLETDLTAPGYHINRQDQLVIEAKEEMAKRGVASPDDADALALTFAARMGPRKAKARGYTGPLEFAWT